MRIPRSGFESQMPRGGGGVLWTRYFTSWSLLICEVGRRGSDSSSEAPGSTDDSHYCPLAWRYPRPPNLAFADQTPPRDLNMLGSAARTSLWGPCCPRGEAHASKHTCVLNEHVSGIPPRRRKCPVRALAELQGGEWGCLQDVSEIANWPAGTSGLTHFPFKRGMSRSVELSLPGSVQPSPPNKFCLCPVSRLSQGHR